LEKTETRNKGYMISFIIPTRNNLPYLKLAHGSIRRFYPEYEIIILDDNSTDGTKEWADSVKDEHTIYYRNDGRQLGHTVLYDKGVELATNDVFTIFHADMVCGPNYVENITKWLKPGGVVAATRIEPPLHPPGKEKIVKDFGTYPEDFKEADFYAFCAEEQMKVENKDIITRGIFAPWAMHRGDFLEIGGHDKLLAPFPYEDSDIFQRMILKHYEINQSRDAFVYHFTCRGHRWTEKVQKDDLFYKLCCAKNTAHFIRKWGTWIENDENYYPVISKKYDIGFVVQNADKNIIGMLEPWCSTIYTDINIDEYINHIQPGTPFDMRKRVKRMSETPTNEVLVKFDAKKLGQDQFNVITNLSKILAESGDIGTLEHDIFTFEIRGLATFENQLVRTDSPYYQNQLRPAKKEDPYCLNALFDIYERVKKSK
jgi:glycosyltransferase involved in cell wall biosynthesis